MKATLLHTIIKNGLCFSLLLVDMIAANFAYAQSFAETSATNKKLTQSFVSRALPSTQVCAATERKVYARQRVALQFGQRHSERFSVSTGDNQILLANKSLKNVSIHADNSDSSLPNRQSLGHTEQSKSKNNQQSSTKNSAQTEQAKLDKGLIEAQIDDVLSSAEFLALENSAEFAVTDSSVESQHPTGAVEQQSEDDPEQLLNQLDASDLMDYVADDDLWKEQLTIEDQP